MSTNYNRRRNREKQLNDSWKGPMLKIPELSGIPTSWSLTSLTHQTPNYALILLLLCQTPTSSYRSSSRATKKPLSFEVTNPFDVIKTSRASEKLRLLGRTGDERLSPRRWGLNQKHGKHVPSWKVGCFRSLYPKEWVGCGSIRKGWCETPASKGHREDENWTSWLMLLSFSIIPSP